MSGLKRVRHRHEDGIASLDWQQFEVLLADHYRRQGWQVEHCGTAGSGHRFDGGVDLVLRRDARVVLVQCKHWNARQVPHNSVHELLGIMVNRGATGAIVVTSGEFTKAAMEAATRNGHVQLIDGQQLRTMLGPLPATTAVPAGDRRRSRSRSGPLGRKHMLPRLIVAAVVMLLLLFGVPRFVGGLTQDMLKLTRPPAGSSNR